MTREPPIPDDVRRFLLTSIPSVPHLEALLLLRTTCDPWNEELLARRLYVSEAKASRVLGDLEEAGFLTHLGGKPPAYRYAPASASLAEMLGRVADAYSRSLIEVTNLIHIPQEARLQLFADAFRFRKD